MNLTGQRLQAVAQIPLAPFDTGHPTQYPNNLYFFYMKKETNNNVDEEFDLLLQKFIDDELDSDEPDDDFGDFDDGDDVGSDTSDETVA